MEAMMMMQFKDLQIIPFDEITKATNNFHEDNYLGGGGFGNVYKGELSRFKERGMVAFKRLDRQYGQGEPEFLKEISTFSQYKHENLIALLGYCIKQREMILVYEYLAHASLDYHLGSRDLTWTQRLKICLQAAEGLRYLHDHNGAHHKVIHCDIKSGNILLDEKWNAKIADVGLSNISSENANLFSIVRGTPGYTDPEYQETYMLTEYSDVYSFGVTLFEVLCGSLCYEISGENKVRVFVCKWKESYQKNKLEEIIFKELSIEQIDQGSLKLFSDIAYQCLEKSREKRPTMVEVVSKLKAALETQEVYDMILKHPLANKYVEIVRTAVSPVKYRSIEELKECLSEGVLVNGGKTWLSINEKGEHIERIYIQACLNLAEIDDYLLKHLSDDDIVNSRFPGGLCYDYSFKFKARVRGEYLTPLISYTANLVFRFFDESDVNSYNPLRYKIDGEAKVSTIYPSHMREDGWFIVPLYHFTSQHTTADLRFEFEYPCTDLLVTGIEFQPSEDKVELPVFEEYQYIIEAASQSLFYRSLDELKQILSQGVHLNGYKTWLSINEKGEHIERIYIQACLNLEDYKLQHQSHEIRFPGGQCYEYHYEFKARVRAEYLTPHISYTLNLIFRYKYQSDVNSYNPLRYKIDGEDKTKVFIIYPTDMREDGWFIVPLYHFTSQHKTVDLQFEFESRYCNLIAAGIEFQPSEEKVELPVFEEYQYIIEAASQSLFYRSLDELKQILSQGVHLNGYKTWFSLNEKGEYCHMISMKDCLIPIEDSTPRYRSSCWSRFPAGLYQTNNKGFKTHVNTQFLSPSVTYTVNLVYESFSSAEQKYVDLRYRLRGEATTSAVYLANKRDDYLHMAELYQFTSDGSIVDLEITYDYHGSNLQVEGILFQPLEKVEDQVSKDDKAENIQTISDSESDTYWEQKFPNDYEEILNLSIDSLRWTTKKELYSILRGGFLIDNGQQWLSVDKHGKKCLMLSAKATWVIDDKNSAFESSHESRFGEVLVITAGDKFELVNEIKPEVLSADITYASYFVYKLPSDQSKFEFPLKVSNKRGGVYYKAIYSYLVSPPNTPVIGQKFDENRYNPLNRHKLSALPRQRSDGWMEVRVWEFQTQKTPETVSMNLLFKHPAKKDLCGLIIHGIELRPI